MMERKYISTEKALERLEALCARSEHCEYELLTKLRNWGIVGDKADAIIDTLRRNRFVDDARFAEAFVTDKYRFSGHGRMKIRLALIAKHVDREIIDEALEAIDEEHYREVLTEIMRNKRRQIPDADSYEGRTKLFRYAASRGFESALISSVMRQMAEEDE